MAAHGLGTFSIRLEQHCTTTGASYSLRLLLWLWLAALVHAIRLPWPILPLPMPNLVLYLAFLLAGTKSLPFLVGEVRKPG